MPEFSVRGASGYEGIVYIDSKTSHGLLSANRNRMLLVSGWNFESSQGWDVDIPSPVLHFALLDASQLPSPRASPRVNVIEAVEFNPPSVAHGWNVAAIMGGNAFSVFDDDGLKTFAHMGNSTILISGVQVEGFVRFQVDSARQSSGVLISYAIENTGNEVRPLTFVVTGAVDFFVVAPVRAASNWVDICVESGSCLNFDLSARSVTGIETRYEHRLDYPIRASLGRNLESELRWRGHGRLTCFRESLSPWPFPLLPRTQDRTATRPARTSVATRPDPATGIDPVFAGIIVAMVVVLTGLCTLVVLLVRARKHRQEKLPLLVPEPAPPPELGLSEEFGTDHARRL